MDHITLYFLCGIMTGILSILFGFGGGFVIVPLLYFLLPKENIDMPIVMHMAIGTSLMVMIVNSSNAAWYHYKNGNVLFTMLRRVIPYLIPGAIVGAILSAFTNSETLRYLFISFLVYTIISTLFKRNFFEIKTLTTIKTPGHLSLAVMGIITGIVATLLGVGGSVITVPYFRNHDMPMINASALGTTLALPVAIVGSITYLCINNSLLKTVSLMNNNVVFWPAFFGIALGGMVGTPLGSYFSKKMPDHVHSKIYLILLAIVTLSM